VNLVVEWELNVQCHVYASLTMTRWHGEPDDDLPAEIHTYHNHTALAKD